MGLGDLIDAAASVWRVPDVEAERCVHSRLETASCRRCLSACPAQAWVMDDDTLGIDMAACDGCGLCLPACPEGAILSDHHPDVRAWRGETVAFAACERALSEEAGGRIPCLHAIGLNDLIGFHRRGITRLILSQADCADCPRSGSETLDDRLSRLNPLLDERGESPLVAVRIGPAQWRELYGLAQDDSQPAVSRRDFLRRAAATTVDHAVARGAAGMEREETFVPPGVLLPRRDGGQTAFFVPIIDETRCNGCDACTRVCAHAAVVLAEAGDVYRLDADRCTGCGLCVDVCDQGAIRIAPWTEQQQGQVALVRRRCRGCGADFHLPAVQQQGDAPLCRICDKTGHFRSLFQVMS